MIRRTKRSGSAKEQFMFSVYRRPSRRGGRSGKRELRVASIRRAGGTRGYCEKAVPYIRMSGLWLERLGFRRGDRIEITEEHERLVLLVRRDEGDLSIN